MTHEHAFRQAIAESPDEDTPRLVYADWLDERGDLAAAARAEFIRAQIALERAAGDDDLRWGLESRAHALLWRYGKGWCGPLRRLVTRWQFRRGFVEAATLPAADFLQHAEELFRLAPLRHVRLLDAREHLPELARCPYLSRLRGLDLRHTRGLDAQTLRPLLDSPHLRLEYLGLRGTGLCSGPGLRALAAPCAGWPAARIRMRSPSECATSGGAREANSLQTAALHLNHFCRTLGPGFLAQKLALADLQRHDNERARKTYQGKRLSQAGCTMNPPDSPRRSFWKSSVSLAAAAPLAAGLAGAQAKEPGGPLLAYVGTFSPPLRDVLPPSVQAHIRRRIRLPCGAPGISP